MLAAAPAAAQQEGRPRPFVVMNLGPADIVAVECAIPFGITGQALNDLAGAARVARDSIRMVTSERPTSDVLTVPRWWGPTRVGYYDGTE